MRLSSKNPWMRLLALGVTIAVFWLAWYLISPLFIDVKVDEGFPTLGPMPSKTPKATATEDVPLAQTAESLGFSPVEATAAMEEAMTAEPSVSNENMPINSGQDMVIIALGDFYNIAHQGQGTATIYSLADGSRLLRFEDFEVLNGPQLHVYLATQDLVPPGAGRELEGAVDLGALKGNIGDQNYGIPAEIDLENFHSVVIWCVPFRVAFNAAPLTPP